MFFTMFSNIPRSVYKCGPNSTLFKIVALTHTGPTGQEPCPSLLKGIDYIKNPRLNKGLAFTIEERQALGIHGLLAAKYHTLKDQLDFCTMAFEKYASDLNKYIYLIDLQDTNERLFYSLISQNVDKFLPIVYTPTVGLACQKFGLIHRQTTGLFLTINDKGHLYNIVKNWPEKDVKAIVFTDGERILGLGDLGAYGMGIPVGKLALYTALAGVPPHQCLPVVLDVGTNNKNLLADPLYIGLRQNRVRGKAYDDFVEEFFEACLKRFGPYTLMQFEDFALVNAARLLEKYRNRACTFNDDIQGTAAVALAGLYASSRINKTDLKDSTFFFFGAGSAATGIASLVRHALIEEGLSEKEATEKIYMFDVNGIISTKRKEGVPENSKLFGRDLEPDKSFESCIAKYKPTCLIGCSTVSGAFTPTILKTMAKNTKRPVVFALSNPTSNAECTAQAAYDNTEGRVIFASGSPFPPVKYNGKEYITGQGNNAYIFPGIALGIIATATHRIPESMFLEAARILAGSVTDEDLGKGLIYPSLDKIRGVSLEIAIGMANMSYKEGLATVFPKPDNIRELITQFIYKPEYQPCLPDFYDYPPLPDFKVKTIEELYGVKKVKPPTTASSRM